MLKIGQNQSEECFIVSQFLDTTFPGIFRNDPPTIPGIA